ncbi:Pyridoxine/pyridoxamine 5'-phosphate oxidase [Chlamydiales bacterium SCGC AG-110-P3]|nr:Pyridoxine/pyridoxamine 5'-phosphate oxidase [Chlamydiales bacterium SCGC AG-110-P3]
MEIEQQNWEYGSDPLLRSDLADSPIDEFARWLERAKAAKIAEPTAMVLCTASVKGIPSSRTVLLKDFSEKGFVFFTNYNSRKGQELLSNPIASATFLWMPLIRQITLEGRVEKLARVDSEQYFSRRPRGSQIAAWASNQGEDLDTRNDLRAAYDTIEKQYHDREVLCPEYWGGFLIIPSRIEFWKGRSNRLHDRFCYTQLSGSWSIARLSP